MRDVDLAALKDKLVGVPGIGALTQTNIGGRMTFGFNGLVVGVDPSKTDDEIAQAILDAADAQQAAKTAAPAQAAPIATPMPAPAAAAAPATPQPAQASSMSVTGATPVGSSLKDMLNSRKKQIAAAHQKITDNFGKLDQATAALNTLGDKVGTEADDLMAIVGQFTNDLG